SALLDRELGLAELVLAEVDGERAGVILDRRDVVDRLAEPFAEEPLEGLTLDVDQVGEVKDVLETRKRLARTRRGDRVGQVRQPPLSELRMGTERKRACRTTKPWACGEPPRIAEEDLQPQGTCSEDPDRRTGSIPWRCLPAQAFRNDQR